MESLLRRQAWQPCFGVVWALLAGLLLAPSQAQAQCGHYVLIGGKSIGDSLNVQAGYEEQMGGFLFIPTPGHKPCSGPGCKQAPLTPPLAPVAPPPVEQKEWGQLPWSFSSPDQHLRTFVYDSLCARPFHHVSIIYHPPRFVRDLRSEPSG